MALESTSAVFFELGTEPRPGVSVNQVKIAYGIGTGAGFWLLAFGFWLLAFGFWLLAFGFWLLAFGF